MEKLKTVLGERPLAFPAFLVGVVLLLVGVFGASLVAISAGYICLVAGGAVWMFFDL